MRCHLEALLETMIPLIPLHGGLRLPLGADHHRNRAPQRRQYGAPQSQPLQVPAVAGPHKAPQQLLLLRSHVDHTDHTPEHAQRGGELAEWGLLEHGQLAVP